MERHKRKIFVVPELQRIGCVDEINGVCAPGSGDSGRCDGNGTSAQLNCTSAGVSAVTACSESGSSATGTCFDFGTGFL